MGFGVQNILIALYGRVEATGIISTRAGRAAFEWAYLRYKRYWEAKNARLLRTLATPGSVVIDVGANIGYFTILFARWVGPEGLVVAIEPEPANVESLRRRMARHRLNQRVDICEAVASDAIGLAHLAVNASNPADHRMAAVGLPVKSVTLDSLSDTCAGRRVSLIKIDVQGHEAAVLEGSKKILRQQPAIFIELDEVLLNVNGSSASSIVDQLAEYGYDPHTIGKEGLSSPLSKIELQDMLTRLGYADFLFLARKC
ncbi:FkbM family methyltransferase [Bosea sp. 2RAB26]|uniref:FkbM family methyltransferase n=1 Tax=Bosea sp. 2RAB26 TaxID=3237476 RepID=UPI003F92855D